MKLCLCAFGKTSSDSSFYWSPVWEPGMWLTEVMCSWAPLWSQLHLFGGKICHIINIRKTPYLEVGIPGGFWCLYLEADLWSSHSLHPTCALSWISVQLLWSSYLTDMIYIVFELFFLDSQASCFYKKHDDMNCSDMNFMKLLFCSSSPNHTLLMFGSLHNSFYKLLLLLFCFEGLGVAKNWKHHLFSVYLEMLK